MSQCEVVEDVRQADAEVLSFEQRSPLDEVLRRGAREMLLQAVEEEVAGYIEAHQQERAGSLLGNPQGRHPAVNPRDFCRRYNRKLGLKS